MVLSKKIATFNKSENIDFLYMENNYTLSGKKTYSILKWNKSDNKLQSRLCNAIVNKSATDIIWNDIINGKQLY